MDKGVRKLVNLKVLNVSGNRIKFLPGEYLPRGLVLLEMKANMIQDLKELANDLPETVLHIGLNHNRLDDGNLVSSRKIDVLL